MRHFITGFEFTPAEYRQMINTVTQWKDSGTYPDLSGIDMTLLFANPSLRTRLSFEAGVKRAGGSVNVLNLAGTWGVEYHDHTVMDTTKAEHIREAAAVISQFTDVIGFRQSGLMAGGTAEAWAEAQKDVPHHQLAKFSSVPVINMESNVYHPCQAAADALTIHELLGGIKGKKVTLTWAPHLKPLPLATPHSQAALPAYLGAEVTIACPPEFQLDPVALAPGGSHITTIHDQHTAVQGADIVIAKSWAPVHHMADAQALLKKYRHWQITSELLATAPAAYFMHCLPVRRGVVVADAVLDGPQSRVIQQAGNRLWAQLGVLDLLLTGKA